MSLLDSIRRPEYTGESRCWPCTAVNAFVVVAVAGVFGFVSPLGVAVLGAGTALIYLRGYVVPGTPEFAPRLVDSLGLESLFPHADEGVTRRSDDLTEADASGEELLAALFEAGVLREAPEGALELSPEFAESWEGEMASLRDRSDEELAAVVADAAPFEAEGEPAYDGLSIEGPTRAVWLSRVHGIADAAAVRALAAAGVPERYRAQATTPLRMFVEACPDCGGDVVETTARECCGGAGSVYDSPADDVLACESCGAIVYQFDEAEDEKATDEDESETA